MPDRSRRGVTDRESSRIPRAPLPKWRGRWLVDRVRFDKRPRRGARCRGTRPEAARGQRRRTPCRARRREAPVPTASSRPSPPGIPAAAFANVRDAHGVRKPDRRAVESKRLRLGRVARVDAHHSGLPLARWDCNCEAGMLNSSKIGAVVFVFGAIAAFPAARAYTIETQFTAKCHEKVTAQALRNARAALEIPATPPATDDERALIDDLQFAPDDDMKDLAGATLLVGVRDNDLKGNSQDDLTVLSSIHGDPRNQREHCLRGPDDKEPGGSAAAVASCRAFIRGRILEALDGLDGTGRPDLAKRTSLALHLSFRGRVDASLPTYYVRIGQAMHAIQDSFTHTYRTPDGTRITVVLDWVDSVNGGLKESEDGPAHATSLDACDDPDDLRKTRRVLATEASTALLVATMDPGKTRDESIAAVE